MKRGETSERKAQVEMAEHRQERFKGMGDEGRIGSQEEMEHILQNPLPCIMRWREKVRKTQHG